MENSARILVITGDGKGKTTAAMGMALRAIGHDLSVAIIQFVKQDPTAEMTALKKFDNVEFIQTGLGFLPNKNTPEFAQHKQAANKGLELAAEKIASDNYDTIILDEICFAVAAGLLDESKVLQAISTARANQCIILTGRDATPAIINKADTVSQIESLKHGYESDIPAQKGVEY